MKKKEQSKSRLKENLTREQFAKEVEKSIKVGKKKLAKAIESLNGSAALVMIDHDDKNKPEKATGATVQVVLMGRPVDGIVLAKELAKVSDKITDRVIPHMDAAEVLESIVTLMDKDK